ncbi:SGNH/GDSL hydrolase family protein [Streptomyces sp. A7024]|uniref:SGNH/GDSL hydrolase family protein n=1 Tax=Streptomyces coryli TaxID=1128680 RepID=A0A6G4TZF8_9ACTN|nr:SGNH/GDSL hydrolase family protein [Streptomyces coryli]NGN65213.1 SGNH/GDSL hydrolase family protein [Streptomyces coryli]
MARSRLHTAVVVLAVTLAASASAAPSAPSAPTATSAASAPGSGTTDGRWSTAWAGSPVSGETSTAACPSADGLRDQTVRNVVTTGAAGDRIRIRLSNSFGKEDLRVGHATVARQGAGAALEPGSLRELTFSGKKSVDVPAGEELFSDPVDLSVKDLARLSISVYVPEATGPVTNHNLGMQHSYISGAGDHAGSADAAPYQTSITCMMLVDGVDVVSGRDAAGTIVTLGDSITDGHSSTLNADRRWPNNLVRRLNERPGADPAVASAAISGNEVLVDRVPVYFGISALNRLDRDVLAQSGAKSVIMLEGINDIGAASADAKSLIRGYQQVIDRVHARGMKIYGGTLVPFMGSNGKYGGDYGSEYGERQRQAVNKWIRTSGAFDGVIDFDKTVRDPAKPAYMLPAYDSGDHLHPGDKGYEAMAETIDLDMILGKR